ncbi:MAG: alpha-L-fucosidase [Lachnospiraceae bacterium]|nr:alpha-L-fucosidase [Lachnospiraceae bacterium]
MLDEKKLVQVVPSPRQLRLQQMEFYAFVHFTVNTFTGLEWGDGTEPETIFAPRKLDAMQWVKAVKDAGMKGLILTCKHHDGFCLWPSAYTEHTVAGSPYKEGKGDVVREVSDACKEAGIAFGVYLSPWDRNSKLYGTGTAYDDYFVAQLTELLTGYGPICSVWFDGACGEGENGKKQVYDWDRYYAVIRKLQPDACIHVCGPDIRWCGNEAGHTREAEWSVVPLRTRDTEKIAENSQQDDSVEFRERTIRAQDADLGSRSVLEGETELIWYPAEVNTSIRPGWFYHPEEDDQVRSLEELVHIYLNSVGGNATFLLNIPPTPLGLFHEKDVERLAELGSFIREAFRNNILPDAELTSEQAQEGHGIEQALLDDYDTYYKTSDGVKEDVITISLPEKMPLTYLVLKENLRMSQRIEGFEVLDGEGNRLYEGSVVGYKKIIPLEEVVTDRLYLRITASRVCPTLAFLGLYHK